MRNLCFAVLFGCGFYLASFNSAAAGLRPLLNVTSGIVDFSPGVVPLEDVWSNPPTVLFTNWPNIREVTSVPDADGILYTGVATDLAIRGAGWFVVQEPETGLLFYKRMGDFRLDANGYLITGQGYRVQGYNSLIGWEIGDIQVDASYAPATTFPGAAIAAFLINRDGKVAILMSDGSEFFRAQILLQQFGAPDELERVDYQLFASTPAALPASTLAAPGAENLGFIEPSSLDVTPLQPQLKSLANPNDHDPLLRGSIARTGRGTDLAVRGAGAFIVRDPVTSELFATRAGMFLVDSNDFLITYDRKRLQGRLQLRGGAIGDIQVSAQAPASTSPGAVMTTFSISRDGRIDSHFSDGTEVGWDQIVLYDFGRPEKLCPVGLGQFAGVNAAQPFPLQNVGNFDITNGWIQSGALELVSITPELLERRRQLPHFTQGALTRTDSPSDLAVNGEGFFQLKNPQNGRVYVTRRGDFRIDAAGYLVSERGFRLQGYCTPDWSEVGDLQIDLQGVPDTTNPNATSVRFVISRDGYIIVHMSDGTEFSRGQVLLQNFREPFLLRAVGGGLYGNLAAAVPRVLAAPGAFGLGSIESSALELPGEPEQLILPPREGFRFMISGEPGSRWTIQASDDLRHWRQIGVVDYAPFETEFCDQGSRQHRARAYRVQAEFALPQFNLPTPIYSNILTNSGAACPPVLRRHRR